MASEAPEVTAEPLFLNCWYCPFVHRVNLALSAKNVDIRRTEIDLANKPEWFPKVSPFGKVPVITYQEGGQTQVLYESLVLAQWVEDYYGAKGPSLLPSSATERARMRIIMARCDESVGKFYKLLRSGSKEEAHAAAEDFRKDLTWLNENIDAQGPYILGSEFRLVDAAALPWLLRAHVLEHYRGFKLSEGLPRLAAYLSALSEDPIVKRTIRPPEGKDWKAELLVKFAGMGGTPVNYFA
mmetsp:Transcript_22115/g.48284  ORF Transcript_22115/g.48284 Transcript_22115/m.48284 type:complete len:240 (+) Transcript_22115:61-780(+)